MVETSKGNPFELVQTIITPLLGPLGTAALVLVLVICMLFQREDLRNRLIRLVGQGRIGATTRAMDDASDRVSRYLRMQLFVNITYGVAVAIGLYFIGVPNAALWGASRHCAALHSLHRPLGCHHSSDLARARDLARLDRCRS